MDLDQTVLGSLPLQQRQQVCRQIRQKQIEKYVQFEQSDRGREEVKRGQTRNKRNTNVHFLTNCLLQDAVDSFDDRQVGKFLQSGGSPNFMTGNGTSLLHRCAAEDNMSAAEILLSHGADVNALDDDWWTPLHTACSCDSVDMVQLLLSKGADVMAIDVDGYFPVDLASDGSEAKSIMTKHLQKLGVVGEKLHQARQGRPQALLNHIKGLPLAADINQLTPNGATLLHIAAANGFRQCLKLLLKYEPDVNKLDSYGWTPLHVAARFNQMKSVGILLKKKADPTIADSLGCKPSAVTSSDEIRGLLMKCERKKVQKDQENMYLELLPADDDDETKEDEENVYHEIGSPEEDGSVVGIFRINSKTVRTRHVTISKEDELMEAKTMYESVADARLGVPGASSSSATVTGDRRDHDSVYKNIHVDDDDDDNDYVSAAIWKGGYAEKGELCKCAENDNLVSMATVQEDGILQEIQKRYTGKQIYTYIGDMLVAVNPFKHLPYYTKDISIKYHTETVASLPPHIYGTAENSYRSLLHDGQSQCHVISGESGSGKTESCKYIIQHLLRVAGSEETNLNTKINQVNPLLEAFGNAVTVMNDNSSRFGKYVELNFTAQGKVTGAKISEYLLEKSRVVGRGAEECGFHIFYWMMAGLSPEEVMVYKLENMAQFRYLRATGSGPVCDSSKSDNRAKFLEVKECLKYIGFSQADIENVFTTLSTVLHLGEIAFHGVGNNEAACITNQDLLKKVSSMLEVSWKELGSALVADYTMTRGEQIKKERTVAQAADCRDALAKSLYGRLFSWLVNGINQLIQPAAEQGSELQIGILDIFGFENFPKNSFEQMCINLANEQIQLYANDHIIYLEQQDCLLEGVPLVDLSSSSNQGILNLFLERHTGILAILDEESSFPKASDRSLATKLHNNPGKKHRDWYKTPKDGGLCFTVVHYAGSVRYDVTGVLEKNRDTLPNSVLYTMKTSNRLLIKELFQSRVTRTGSLAPSARQQRSRRTTVKKSSSPFEFFKKLRGNKETKKKPQRDVTSERKGPSTMAYHFRNSLSDLVSKLQAARPQFVRCIKPNSNKAALTFNADYVLAQLRYTGISDVVKVRKYGYAMRITLHEFLQRYQALVKGCLPVFSPMADEKKCRCVLQHYNIGDVKFGKTKLFFKQAQVDHLDREVDALQKKVIKAQSVVRGFLGRRRSQKLSCAREERNRALGSFFQEVSQHSNKLGSHLSDSCRHDAQHDSDLEQSRSLEMLDEVINIYETAFPEGPCSLSPSPHSPSPLAAGVVAAGTGAVDDDDDPMYDDAFSAQLHRDEIRGDVDGQSEDTMNGQLHRGLPPTPTHTVHMDPSRPPPCPREMYAQGMYSSVDDQVEYRRNKPPPPKRSPDTRLSTSSNSSAGAYEELHVEDASHHYPSHHQQHHHHHQQQQHQHQSHHQHHHHHHHQHGDPNLPQRHTTHGSPVFASKFSHEPQSPSGVGNRPFSYGAPMMSPKLQHAPVSNQHQNMANYHQNGHSRSVDQVLPNYQYHDSQSGSPAASYGKHESGFHPQPHHPPPLGPPPPPPPGREEHAQSQQYRPQSPHMQRHSVASVEGSVRKHKGPRSPQITPKLSQRSKSVPCNPDEEYLPAPPPPLSVKENYLAAALHTNRPPSPPLPPPPPEMFGSPRNSANLPSNVATPSTGNRTGAPSGPGLPSQPVTSHQAPPSHHPPPPPTNYPTHHAPPPPVVPAYKAPPPAPSHQPSPPPPPPITSIPKRNSPLPDVKHSQQTNMAGNNVGAATTARGMGVNSGAPAMGDHSSSPVRSSREASPSAAMVMDELSKIQLRKTGLKVMPEVSAPRREPSPPPVSLPPPLEEPNPPAPPPGAKEMSPTTQVSPTVNLFEKKAEELSKPKADNKTKNQGDTSKNSKMEINLDQINLDEIPGYIPITKSTPVWKRDMIEKKNQEKIEEYIRKKEKEKQEQEKWKNVPAWKRKLMVEKEREKEQRSVEDEQKAAQEELNRKRMAKEAEEQRRQRIKDEQELEKKMEEEMQDVPAWKREIMMKRGGAIKNWGDEREDVNDQEGEEDGSDRGSQSDQISAYPAPTIEPNRTFTQKAKLVLSETNDNCSQPSKAPAPPAQPRPARPSLDETKLEEEWESMPLWKREIMMKRGGAPTNWGDEREETEEEAEH